MKITLEVEFGTESGVLAFLLESGIESLTRDIETSSTIGRPLVALRLQQYLEVAKTIKDRLEENRKKLIDFL